MITAEIRVNAGLIGHLYVRQIDELDEGQYLYTVEYYELESGEVIKARLQHDRKDGAVTLMRKALEIIEDIKADR